MAPWAAGDGDALMMKEKQCSLCHSLTLCSVCVGGGGMEVVLVKGGGGMTECALCV